MTKRETWTDGTVYLCSDEGYFCELLHDGTCEHCNRLPAKPADEESA